MEGMTTCEPCTLREQDQAERADVLEGIRVQRLMLAIVNGAADAGAVIAAELGSCYDCMARLSAQLVVMNTELMARVMGSVDNVKQGPRAGDHGVRQRLAARGLGVVEMGCAPASSISTLG